VGGRRAKAVCWSPVRLGGTGLEILLREGDTAHGDIIRARNDDDAAGEREGGRETN